MKTVPTYTATIYVGLRPVARGEGPDFGLGEVLDLCQGFCDAVGLCVTVTETTFVYTKGEEPGVIVGLINDPRFPKEPGEIRALALRLSSSLALKLEQRRVSVVFPDETVMLGEEG